MKRTSPRTVSARRPPASGLLSSSAFLFVITMGVVNLFGDMTYEGGASINGPFLGSLGASAASISIIAGLGEFLGYSLRAVSGYVADRSRRYWLVTGVGYLINLLAVPAMALAGSWYVAGALILAERFGRAIRKPTVEAMLSYSATQHGRGWVYAVNTALDETGATLGPLLMAWVLATGGSHRRGYSVLLAPALLALLAVVLARTIFPAPQALEGRTRLAHGDRLTRAYWYYMSAAACFGAGLMSFEFVSYHLSTQHLVAEQWIPLWLGCSTGVGILASLGLGRLYDRIGMTAVISAVLVSACFSPLVFLGTAVAAFVGLMLWGVGYAVQDTLLKAIVAGLLPEGKRGLAFGVFYTGYGIAWLAGSAVTGLLYQRSTLGVVIFAVAVQCASIPWFVAADRAERHRTT